MRIDESRAAAALFLGLLVLPQGAEARAFDYDARVTTDIALMVITPNGKIANADTSDIIRIAGDALRDHTDLQVTLAEELGCHGSYACYVEIVRKDYALLKGDFARDPQIPFAEVRRRLAALPQNLKSPRYLILLGARPADDGSDRFFATLLDTEDALGHIHSAGAGGALRPEQENDLSATIAENSARATTGLVTVTSDDGVERFIRDLIEKEFRPELEQSGNWHPYGAIELVVAHPGMEIELDGVELGATRAGSTLIGNVLRGPHVIQLSHPELLSAKGEVVVTAEAIERLNLDVAEKPHQLTRTVRQGVFWSGVALAAAGAALTTLAIVQAAGQENRIYCVSSPQEGCPPMDAEFLQTPSPFPGGAPLGYSMFGAGVSWSLGTAMIGDEDSLPYVPLAIGVGVFTASYLISIAASGVREPCTTVICR